MASVTVLIVDDNRNYREAFRRNLLLQGYDVLEAEDSEEAIETLTNEHCDVVVTDLSMRHETEGLDLIRQARAMRPLLPVIMISAVGTFEEGAEASRLGARYVISKSKIDEEIENLFSAIDKASEEYAVNRSYAERINELSRMGADNPSEASSGLRELMTQPDATATIKGQAFDAYMELTAGEQARLSRQDVERAAAAIDPRGEFSQQVQKTLHEALAKFDQLDEQSRETLQQAEYLYQYGEQIERGVDFSRSIGFNYCFAVENEAKNRLRKRLQRFFADGGTRKLIESLFENNRKSLSLFYHQYLLRLQREAELDVTIDNVYQTFKRIVDLGQKYKPDGLKALGIVTLCFGREYSFRKFQQEIHIDNPLQLKGFGNSDEVVVFSRLLTNLQHYRNPYIHPEISEMEKLSKIRKTSFDCLNMIVKLV